MTTPAEIALGKIVPLADTPGRRRALEEMLRTTAAFRARMNAEGSVVAPSDVLSHRLTHPFLQAKITDTDFLSKLGGDSLVRDLRDLRAFTKTRGYPGFEIANWPSTIGQLYAVLLTPIAYGHTPFVYGFDEKGSERIERSLVPVFQKNLTNPTFQEDTIAISEFLALIHERGIPPLVVVGGLGVVTGGEFSQLPIDELPIVLRSQFKNVASDTRATSITLSEFERNEVLLRRWTSALQSLRRQIPQ